jgi:hypothetical protein
MSDSRLPIVPTRVLVKLVDDGAMAALLAVFVARIQKRTLETGTFEVRLSKYWNPYAEHVYLVRASDPLPQRITFKDEGKAALAMDQACKQRLTRGYEEYRFGERAFAFTPSYPQATRVLDDDLRMDIFHTERWREETP